MPYIAVEDFRIGLDTRRSAIVAPPGSLQRCENANINRGGEIEKRKALEQSHTLPADTFGLVATDTSLYAFGSAAAPTMPSGILYQRLAHPSGAPRVMTELLDATSFGGKIFAIAKYDNGDIFPFYDGTVVAHFQSGSGAPVAGLKPTACIAFKTKVWVAIGSKIYQSKVDDATDWSGTGSGNIPLNNNFGGSLDVGGIGIFANNLVFLSSLATQIWFVDPDPTLNRQLQTLPNIGTTSNRSVVQFGDTDSFFLAFSGIRSIRPRQGSDTGTINDIGTPIDTLILEAMRSLGATATAAAAGTLDPIDGRFLLAIGPTIYAFSYFPASKISAWSTWTPGFTVSDWATFNNRIYARSGDAVYLYGGADGITYDTSEVTVDLPHLDAKKIATEKSLHGLDVVCEGVWEVYAGTDPENPDERELVATLNGTTTNLGKLPLDGYGTSVQLRFINSGAGAAKLSLVVAHHEDAVSG